MINSELEKIKELLNFSDSQLENYYIEKYNYEILFHQKELVHINQDIDKHNAILNSNDILTRMKPSIKVDTYMRLNNSIKVRDEHQSEIKKLTHNIKNFDVEEKRKELNEALKVYFEYRF